MRAVPELLGHVRMAFLDDRHAEEKIQEEYHFNHEQTSSSAVKIFDHLEFWSEWIRRS